MTHLNLDYLLILYTRIKALCLCSDFNAYCQALSYLDEMRHLKKACSAYDEDLPIINVIIMRSTEVVNDSRVRFMRENKRASQMTSPSC